MKDTFDDLFDEWCQTSKALCHAFFYDNQLPIDDLTRQFEGVWVDLQRLSTLSRKARGKPLSLRDQITVNKLLRKEPQARLEKLIHNLQLFRAEWNQEHHPVNHVSEKLRSSRLRGEWHKDKSQAKDNELVAAELLCRRLLEEFRAACPEVNAINNET